MNTSKPGSVKDTPAHTPAPWEVHDDHNYPTKGWREIWSADRKPVVVADAFDRTSHGETETHFGVRISVENAAYIVKSANAYPKLVEALKALTETGHTPEDADEYRRKALTAADDLLHELGEME